LTFVGLPIPEIIGGTSKIWGVPGFAHALFSPKFCMQSVALVVPEIIVTAVLGWGFEPPILGKRRP